ncbi:alkaline phosphatase D family protein [Pleomorphovibrio marinus]|uniref:alkaline phosphatase D family protein n=1 Tax=Pleomorphovibrio marinus TaxID=2164132 RepID=UPI0018E588C2|nr:alkaline phosphatase D family protein [Pleomorphovibrio marinus]
MKITILISLLSILLTNHARSNNAIYTAEDTVQPRHKVTLREAHIGDLEIDTRLLDSYLELPENERSFYLQSRKIFEENPEVDFTDPKIVNTAKKLDIPLMGGPMLGRLNEEGVSIWLRPATTQKHTIAVYGADGREEKSYDFNPTLAGLDERVDLQGLSANTSYTYSVYVEEEKVAGGEIKTAPKEEDRETFSIAFGSCFHKIGLHNPNLINQILGRSPDAMMILGDIAVDDRRNLFNMHLADYLLRDVSKPWRELSANIPLYTSWDDHDYFDDDLGGVPEGFTEEDRVKIRELWEQNWINPPNGHTGIYFNDRVGPVEMIMLDTRSLRDNERRMEYGAYLGSEQLTWLKEKLKNSTAPYKVISSGTMWSDYISKGKDSWGTWDPKAREELFDFIVEEKIPGVLLISGDRHGARAFTIPHESGFGFHEFQVATLSGVPGPEVFADDSSTQLFGYAGLDLIAFGEFTFIHENGDQKVEFRLIDQYGEIMEEITVPYEKLSP